MSNLYTLNEKFFSDWSPEMAYVLGFIYADGNMSRDAYKIRINSKDVQILEDIKMAMKSTHPIKKECNEVGSWYTFMISNKSLYGDLRRLGIFPNKSLTMRFPRVPKEYMKDFIRGYFDGDGCIYEVKRKRPTPGMEIDFATGSKNFATQLINVLHKDIHESIRLTNPRKNYYRIRGWNQASQAIFTYMYSENPTLYLKRKYEKFLDIMNRRK